MLKHMLNANGVAGNRHTQPDNSTIMESRVDQGTHRYHPTNAPNSSRISQISQHQSCPLNVSQFHTSVLDNSKHSMYNTSLQTQMKKTLNGGLDISRPQTQGTVNKFIAISKQVGVKEMLVSLGLLCLVSLLLALLSLIFLLKISPVTVTDIREFLRAEQLTVITAEEYVVVYEVTLALCALTLSLNLCCLLVCSIQFLFAVKLVKSPHGGSHRTNKYLQKSSISRVCAVGGFFISIPVFLTGIILYTFIQFHSTPAIVTSVFIGLGIIFCGCAMVHNVFIWQKEKTNAVKELALQQHEQSIQQQIQQQQPINNTSIHSISSPITQLNHSFANSFNHNFVHSSQIPHANASYILRPATATPSNQETLNLTKASHPREASGSVSPGMPNTVLELSSVATTNSPHELSTLV